MGIVKNRYRIKSFISYKACDKTVSGTAWDQQNCTDIYNCSDVLSSVVISTGWRC